MNTMYLKMKGIYANMEPTLQFIIESKKLSAKKKKQVYYGNIYIHQSNIRAQRYTYIQISLCSAHNGEGN